jgi:N-acetylmuramic acid 6-phosphate (MurNAc-6-P) etherase
MDLKKLAQEVGAVAAAITGVAPTITTVVDLVQTLEKVGSDLKSVPLGTDGQPLTLDAAQAHLASSVAASQRQDQAIRDQANAALAENAAEGKTE